MIFMLKILIKIYYRFININKNNSFNNNIIINN